MQLKYTHRLIVIKNKIRKLKYLMYIIDQHLQPSRPYKNCPPMALAVHRNLSINIDFQPRFFEPISSFRRHQIWYLCYKLLVWLSFFYLTRKIECLWRHLVEVYKVSPSRALPPRAHLLFIFLYYVFGYLLKMQR